MSNYKSSRLNLYDSTNFVQVFEIKNENDQVSFSAENQTVFSSQSFNINKTDALGATIASIIDVAGSINNNTTNIAQEILDRENAVEAVQINLDSEVNARTTADTALQDGILTEVNARIASEIVINGRIDTEITDRINADVNLQNQITSLSSVVASGINWKAPVENFAGLDSVYAADSIGDVRLVKSEKDAFIKVAVGEGESFALLTGDAQTSYVRFMDSKEIASGLADEANARSSADASLQSSINQEVFDRTNADTVLQQNITNETDARSAQDVVLQSNIDVEKGRIDTILSSADVNLDTFQEVVSYVNSLDITQLNLITTLQNDLAQLRIEHDALRAEWNAFAPGPRGNGNGP